MREAKVSLVKPKIDVDLDDVTDLAAEGNDRKDIAAVLGYQESVLFSSNGAQDAFEKGRAQLVVNLRHWQMECAKSGNPQMLALLGKQYLEQGVSAPPEERKPKKLL